MIRAPGYRSLRKGRVSIPGQIYLVTTVTHRRRRLFVQFGNAYLACRCTHDSTAWLDARLLCWVLMPDHWHGLLQLGKGATLGQVMSCWKCTVTRSLHRHGCNGRIWQDGFHDHALRREENVMKAARYIVANPVRAGLADSVLQYPYWNCIWVARQPEASMEP